MVRSSPVPGTPPPAEQSGARRLSTRLYGTRLFGERIGGGFILPEASSPYAPRSPGGAEDW